MDIKKQVEEVLGNFPTLHHAEVNNSLIGELFISACDSYDVRIELNGYPKHFPKVYEVGERIPKEIYRHIYSDTGSCCLTTKAKAEILLKLRLQP